MVQYVNVAHTRLTDVILTRNGIALFSLKLRMYVPSRGCDNKRSYKCGELRKYSAAASNRNGVVGSSGRKIPITPSESDNVPNIVSIVFICCCTSKFYCKGSDNLIVCQTFLFFLSAGWCVCCVMVLKDKFIV